MKTTLRLAALGFALSLTSPAVAQQSEPRGGIGIALSNLDTGSLFTGGFPAAHVYVPFVISPGMRIEPELGVLKLEDDQDPSQDVSVYTLGVGLLFTRRVGEDLLAYVGPRLAVSRVSQPVDDPFGPASVDAVGTDLRIAGAIGGEYFFSPRFSLGGEAQLAFTSVGDRDVSGVGTIRGGSSIATHALVFFRAYIF